MEFGPLRVAVKNILCNFDVVGRILRRINDSYLIDRNDVPQPQMRKVDLQKTGDSAAKPR